MNRLISFILIFISPYLFCQDFDSLNIDIWAKSSVSGLKMNIHIKQLSDSMKLNFELRKSSNSALFKSDSIEINKFYDDLIKKLKDCNEPCQDSIYSENHYFFKKYDAYEVDSITVALVNNPEYIDLIK